VVAGTNGSAFYTVNNGLNWTQSTIASAANFSGTVSTQDISGGLTAGNGGANGTIVLVGNTTNAAVPPARVSVDGGATFTVPGTGNANLAGAFRSVATQPLSANSGTNGSGIFVAVGANSANANAGVMSVTTNALANWTVVSTNIATGNALNDVTFSSQTSTWIAVGNAGNIKFSSTASANSALPTTWSNAAFPNTAVQLLHVAAGQDPNGNSVVVFSGKAGFNAWAAYTNTVNASPTYTVIPSTGPGSLPISALFTSLTFANFAGQIGFWGLSTDSLLWFSPDGANWSQLSATVTLTSQPRNAAIGTNNTIILTGQNDIAYATAKVGSYSGTTMTLSGTLEAGGQLFGIGSLASITTTVPQSVTSPGQTGQVAVNLTNNNLYICVAPNTWRKISLTAIVP
jgi:hypothetical protein